MALLHLGVTSLPEREYLNDHFVDITKIFMENIYKNQACFAHTKFVTDLLKCRGRLADIKHEMAAETKDQTAEKFLLLRNGDYDV